MNLSDEVLKSTISRLMTVEMTHRRKKKKTASSASFPAEITIRVDESECLSMASSHDQETERFLSTGTTGRRVSFNEAALFDHGKKTQEKGRRLEPQST